MLSRPRLPPLCPCALCVYAPVHLSACAGAVQLRTTATAAATPPTRRTKPGCVLLTNREEGLKTVLLWAWSWATGPVGGGAAVGAGGKCPLAAAERGLSCREGPGVVCGREGRPTQERRGREQGPDTRHTHTRKIPPPPSCVLDPNPHLGALGLVVVILIHAIPTALLQPPPPPHALRVCLLPPGG